MAQPSVPSRATTPGQSATTLDLETRSAGILVVPVMFGLVVVVDEDVVVSDRMAPPLACGRDGDPEWQSARTTDATAVRTMMDARFMSALIPAATGT